MAKKSARNQQVSKPGRHGGPRPNSGGRRPGAGRPKRAVAEAKLDYQEQTVETIGQWLPDLLRNHYELAMDGDRAAGEYLMNRLLGRPTERVETSGDSGVQAISDALNRIAQGAQGTDDAQESDSSGG